MKMNSKCARAVLLQTEKIPFGETITVAKLHTSDTINGKTINTSAPMINGSVNK